MSRLTPEEVETVGQHVTAAPGQRLSLAALAKRLGVTIQTARRRLHAYAAAHALPLLSERKREGARGPASEQWFFGAPEVKKPEVHADVLSLAPEVLSALAADELEALRLLATSGTARTGELATRLGRTPDRMEGFMRLLRRKLHRLGSPLIENETLPDGEALFRYTGTRGA